MSRLDNDPPCDFLTYLEWRLGEDEDATARLLGEWLATYKSELRSTKVTHEQGRARDMLFPVDGIVVDHDRPGLHAAGDMSDRTI